MICKPLIIKLPDQGSNLDSSDSESDVLPITPSGTFYKVAAKINLFDDRKRKSTKNLFSLIQSQRVKTFHLRVFISIQMEVRF